MPGISGIISANPGTSQADHLEQMVQCMVHGPFYRSGSLRNETLGVHVGWTCFQDSFADCMPVWNEARDVCLIFSGEHFFDPQQKADLKARGHDVRGADASWLIHLYEELGGAFFERLNGWFNGLLLDLREKKVILFNDRYGIGRIYYHENESGFYFASEAKALLKVLPETRRLDYRGLGEYFSCGCVLQNRTLFDSISLLPGGSAWTFSPGQPARKDCYFNRRTWEQLPQLSPDEFYRELRHTWARILPRYLNGTEPLALSMTGGVDSRMILACAQTEAGKLPCYTFGGMYRDCADIRVSRRVARLCGQPHETIPLDANLFGEFPVLAEKAVYLTDGTLDVTGATDLYVHQRVRQIAPVRVTGLYGGEILRGLVAFKPMRQARDHLTSEFADSLQTASQTYSDELNGHRQSFIAFKQAPWHIYSRLCIERSQVTIRTPYFDNDLVALSYQAPPESLSYGPALRLIAEARPFLKGVGTDRAVGVRPVPGLAQARHLLQQFTYKAEYAYDYGMPQWLARVDHLFAPFHIERLFLGRHKYYHFRLWYRDHLHRYLSEILLDPGSLRRPYLRGADVEKMVRGHIGGQRNYTLEIHRLLTAELVQRTLIGQAPERGEAAGTGSRRSCSSTVCATA